MAADPDDHALLDETHVLLPVGEIDVTAHATGGESRATMPTICWA